MNSPIKKIVVTGPESTGKSTLCEQLAMHYNTIWCPEFAREYLLKNGTAYTFENLLEIAEGQLALEEQAIRKAVEQNKSMVILDTDLYVLKVWCEFVFGKCHPWILEQIAKREYDLYLLCNTDLPWIKDALREYPDIETRNKLFSIYKDLLINQSTAWAVIEGDADQRTPNAIRLINAFLAGQTNQRKFG